MSIFGSNFHKRENLEINGFENISDTALIQLYFQCQEPPSLTQSNGAVLTLTSQNSG